MKKLIMLLLPALALFNACEPVRTDNPMGGVLSAGELKVRADNPGGSNKVTLINETPGVTVQWNYLIGVAVGDKIEVVMPFGGEIPIKLTAFCDGGIVESSTSVNITNMDAAVAPEWSLFAGQAGGSGKTWVWDDTRAGSVYGTGGYGNDWAPAWSMSGIGATVTGQVISADDKMVFDLNGGANFTKTSVNGSGKGTFKFDMSSDKQKVTSKGDIWAIGELTLYDATVLCPCEYYGGTTPVYVFDIIELTEDKMVLAYAAPGSAWEQWNTVNFWMFKAQ